MVSSLLQEFQAPPPGFSGTLPPILGEEGIADTAVSEASLSYFYGGKRGSRTLQALKPPYLISMAPPPTCGFYADSHRS